VKKTVTTLTFLMLVIFLLPIAASAADTGDEKITSDDFAVEISDETSKILESMGIENIDYDSLISASPRKIITCIIDIAKGKLKEPVKTLGIVLSIAVVAAVVGSFAPSKTAEKYSVGTVCSFLIVSALSVPLASTLSSEARAPFIVTSPTNTVDKTPRTIEIIFFKSDIIFAEFTLSETDDKSVTIIMSPVNGTKNIDESCDTASAAASSSAL